MPKGVYKRVKPVWNKGKKLGPNPEHSARMKGKPSWNKGLIGWTKGTGAGFQGGHKPYYWKGVLAGKRAIHLWVEDKKGRAINNKCVDCGGQAKDWSNKDHKYSRNLDDYSARCRLCHRQYDKSNNSRSK